MNSNSFDQFFWQERASLPKYLTTPWSGRNGCKELSTKSPTNSTPKNSMSSKYSPDHYKNGIETWDYIVSHNLGYLEGNIIKYITRAGLKDGESTLDDLLKAKAYLTKLIEQHV